MYKKELPLGGFRTRQYGSLKVYTFHTLSLKYYTKKSLSVLEFQYKRGFSCTRQL